MNPACSHQSTSTGLGSCIEMRRLVLPIAAVVIVGIVVLGLTQTGGQKKSDTKLSLAEMQQSLKGAPAPLAAVYRKGNTIVGGSTKAFQQQVNALKGHPVVINKWASWCGPCRAEFPMLQHAASRYGKQVGFLGVNSNDHDAAARSFLKNEALPYPSYSDGNLAIAGKLGIVPFFPTTVFLDRNGKRQYVHQGYYTSTDQLERDIRRYALGTSS